MEIVLAADMHLKPGGQPQQNKRLQEFLQHCSREHGRLLLLGDTFNCWYERGGEFAGDFGEVLSIFGSAVKSGLEVILISGNRDFIFSAGHRTLFDYSHTPFQSIGESLYSALDSIGISLQGDSCEFVSGEKSCYCTHGDLYCTADFWHQLLRYLLMGKPARFLASFIPVKLVDWFFSCSGAYEKSAYVDFGDVSEVRLPQHEALAPLIDSGVDIVFCGHLHKFMRMSIDCSEKHGELIVLPSWAGGEYLVVKDGDVAIKKVSCS